MSSGGDLIHLASKLREENVFVKAETAQLTRLNAQLASSIDSLYHEGWVARSQRRALDILMAQRNDIPADSCLQKLLASSATTPIDGYRVLGHRESSFGECIKMIRDNPELIAECLVRSERSNPERMQDVIRIIMGSVFGYGLIPEDQEQSRKFLKALMDLQLNTISNPRRLLNNVSGFSYAYKIFVENLQETKLFLAAALHGPIFQVLVEDDLYLDIDPSKTILRFSDEEKVKRFGPVVGCDFYNKKVQEHRQIVMARLVKFVKRFIQALVDNMFSFPPSLCWLINQIYERIQSRHPQEPSLPAVICTDLVFAHFICPAVVQPELYALTSDIPVSKTASVNLMQIAQALQIIAVSKWEKPDARHSELYSANDAESIWNFLSAILQMRPSDNLVQPQTASECIARSSIIMSLDELDSLISFLKDMVADKSGAARMLPDALKKTLNSLPKLDGLSKRDSSISSGSGTSTPTTANKNKRSKMAVKLTGIGSLPGGSDSDVDVGKGEEHIPQLLSISLDAKVAPDLGLLPEHKVLALSKRSAKKRLRSADYNNDSFEMGSVDDEAMSAFSVSSSIPDSASMAGVSKNGLDGRARSDDASTFPSADGLRAVSEEAGPHSIVSSLEAAPMDQDNLSDAGSAGISGQASPNVSGRDTPSPPQEGEGDAVQVPPAPAPINGEVLRHLLQPNNLPVTVQKENRDDVPDRFGKFDIPVDETKSTMSDAWSTEVAGSEFDPFLDGQNAQNGQFNPLTDPVFAAAAAGAFDSDNEDPVAAIAAAGGFDSDTDRWSVDVAASPSNASQLEPLEARMAELENEQELIGLEPQPMPSADPIPDVPILPNPPGKYVSFASDNQFHHYPSEHDLIDQRSVSSGRATIGDNSRVDLDEDEDPTLNVPLSEFAPIRPMPELSLGGSIPSTCSSFSNLSALSSLSDADRASGHGRRSGEMDISGTFGSPNLSMHSESISVPLSPGRPPSIGRKNSLPKDTSPVVKTAAIRQLSFGGTFSVGHSNNDSNASSSSRTTSNGKKTSFLKSLNINIRGKHRTSAAKSEPILVDLSETPPPGPVKDHKTPAAESPFDIMEKYRQKSSSKPPVAAVEPNGPAGGDARSSVLIKTDYVCQADFAGLSQNLLLETAKRKVRLAFNMFDLVSIPSLKMRLSSAKSGQTAEPALLSLLKIQLSEAISLQDRACIAQLHEAIRCVKGLEPKGVSTLVDALRSEYRARDVYIAYLVRCRKVLLNGISHIERLTFRTKRDSTVCCKYFFSLCVSRFLEKHESDIKRFTKEFREISVSDEKTMAVENFLESFGREMLSESLWRRANEEQVSDARETLERQIMSQIYLSAFYPNGEVDRSRDQVLHDHMQKLAASLTPDHKDLRISKVFHVECPWPSAQAEIIAINAYKTPKDKVQCVVRCSATLMNLLSMAAESSVPAADDFMPALVYVLIRANPPSLLSTVQYVNSFYGKRLAGEESYWWTQFASAIEYIKNMRS